MEDLRDVEVRAIRRALSVLSLLSLLSLVVACCSSCAQQLAGVDVGRVDVDGAQLHDAGHQDDAGSAGDVDAAHVDAGDVDAAMRLEDAAAADVDAGAGDVDAGTDAGHVDASGPCGRRGEPCCDIGLACVDAFCIEGNCE